MPDIVVDTCVLSNFALAGAFGLLDGLYRGRVHITDFVSAEVTRGLQGGHKGLAAIPGALKAGWLKETALSSAEEKALFESLSRSLGLGEASSLAVAKCRGYIFGSDDRVARAEAGLIGVRLTGTLGILTRAVRTGRCGLAAADAYLARMIENGFFSPVRSIREVVNGNP